MVIHTLTKVIWLSKIPAIDGSSNGIQTSLLEHLIPTILKIKGKDLKS
jgi:hypothetical protein